MRKKITLLLFGVPFFGYAQSVIGSINSGAVSSDNFTHSVGEIYVIPTDPDKANSGTMGMFYQSVLQVLGVTELEKDNVKIYPNPTADFVHIKLNSKSKIEDAQIYDLSGKLILQANLESEKLDLRSLPQGVYMIIFKNSDIKPIKIIKKP
ncbi:MULTISPECIES: T9SS type A sorting domain-containing protein [Chryseobacterium]|uniref:Por secretion system C-terminal sorting domain n=1 Tax=Chryseobacterium taihuense TaxID=1141221 RepID=A0A4U8W7Y9_9FLAO|nr:MULTISPECIES: T9SS type A sorting domain-containing protein [Chryseobacterium]QQV01303.1 T9SS type A sorting domain-containing protein [Chryseobacterium sp. FDAARGOS 1104]VFB02103.1 Por secretion system C-terminal sorting domain [Chryseobacterium taihuense]